MVRSKISYIIKKYGIPDIAFLNAGTNNPKSDKILSVEETKKIFDVNFFSQFFFTQTYLKLLNNSKNGSIVFVSSNSSIDNPVGRVAYSSSKAAINSLAVTLSRESGAKNLRVNAVLPGLTNTKMANNFTKKEAINEYINDVSLKRIAEPDEITNVITFLSSDNASFINGQLIKVDGGR